METFIIYILKTSACLTIFYLGFLVLYRNSVNFKQQRAFLLISIVLSLSLPFNNISFRTAEATPEIGTIVSESNSQESSQVSNISLVAIPAQEHATILKNPTFYLKGFYLGVLTLLLIRLLLGIFKFVFILANSRPQQYYNQRIYLSGKIQGSTSFFGILFINPKLGDHPNLSKIISHENIHASQYHTLDVLLVELLAAAMWFNPVVWFLRRSLQQLHEYLADEGVIKAGIDRLEYQKLLVNHIAEETLLLTSGFQSSIKKRIIMMSKTHSNQKSRAKLVYVLPLSVCLLIGISFTNAPAQQKKTSVPSKESPQAKPTLTPSKSQSSQEPVIAAVALSKMNVMYLGVDNPVKIAVSNHSPSEIKVMISNGTLSTTNSGYDYNYIARPRQVGMAIVAIYVGDKLVGKEEYRVKRVPDPVAKVSGIKSGGYVDKNLFTSESTVEADMQNFDFDMQFSVTSFKVETNVNGYMVEKASNSNKFTPEQLNLIKNTNSEQKLYITEVKAVGPDGFQRELPPVVFKIKD